MGTTYAPRGKRPCIQVNSSVSDRLYVASAVSAQGRLLFHHRNEPYDTDGIIDFLKYLLEVTQTKLLVVWDGASIHKSKKLKEFLAQYEQAKRLHLVIQPAYSPELNADEQVWQWLKNVALKNACLLNFKELKTRVLEQINRLAETPALLKNFFLHPDLDCYQFFK